MLLDFPSRGEWPPTVSGWTVIEMSVPLAVVTRTVAPGVSRSMVLMPMANISSAGKRPYSDDSASTVLASLLM